MPEVPKFGQRRRGDGSRFAELELLEYKVTRLGGARKAMLLGYCDPNTDIKRRELVLLLALMGCLVYEAMMYCVRAKARSLSGADWNWSGPSLNAVRCCGER